MNATPPPPPCPTPVCTPVTNPDGSTGIVCTSVYCPPVCGPDGPVNDCCQMYAPGAGWQIVCADGPWPAPVATVPTLSDAGFLVLAVLVALVGLRRVAR